MKQRTVFLAAAVPLLFTQHLAELSGEPGGTITIIQIPGFMLSTQMFNDLVGSTMPLADYFHVPLPRQNAFLSVCTEKFIVVVH